MISIGCRSQRPTPRDPLQKNIKAGEVFTEENVKSIRPGYGLHPKYLKDILGKKARKDIKKGTPLSWDLVG
jgi:pseudaminic acid synthase